MKKENQFVSVKLVFEVNDANRMQQTATKSHVMGGNVSRMKMVINVHVHLDKLESIAKSELTNVRQILVKMVCRTLFLCLSW